MSNLYIGLLALLEFQVELLGKQSFFWQYVAQKTTKAKSLSKSRQRISVRHRRQGEINQACVVKISLKPAYRDKSPATHFFLHVGFWKKIYFYGESYFAINTVNVKSAHIFAKGIDLCIIGVKPSDI